MFPLVLYPLLFWGCVLLYWGRRRVAVTRYRMSCLVLMIWSIEAYFLWIVKFVFYSLNPPIPMYPGDEVKTTCTFSSENQNKTVYYGAGTNDEMCYGFLDYYPAQNIQYYHCTTWKSVEKCIRRLPQFEGIYEGCSLENFMQFKDNSATNMFKSLNESCYNSDCF